MALKLTARISRLISSFTRTKAHRRYEEADRSLFERLKLELPDRAGEVQYLNKWKDIVGFPTPWAYRLHQHFIDKNKEWLLSQEAANVINNVLNPERYVSYYSDKNTFDKIFLPNILPNTILRKIGGNAYAVDYQQITPPYSPFLSSRLSFDTLILKPTISDSGRGVTLFKKCEDGAYRTTDGGITLDEEYLKQCGENVILQEGLKQHPFMARLNQSSVNTFRFATYRSVVDGEIKILSCVIRIGGKGNEVDNLHQGGRMVRVDDSGKLAGYCIDQYGTRYNAQNDIDFSKEELFVPNYNKIIDFAKSVAQSVPFSRLLQLDVMLDADGQPKLIEFNCTAFSMWIAQFTGTPALGQWSEEIYEYTKAKLASRK